MMGKNIVLTGVLFCLICLNYQPVISQEVFNPYEANDLD